MTVNKCFCYICPENYDKDTDKPPICEFLIDSLFYHNYNKKCSYFTEKEIYELSQKETKDNE